MFLEDIDLKFTHRSLFRSRPCPPPPAKKEEEKNPLLDPPLEKHNGPYHRSTTENASKIKLFKASTVVY